ncbi:hypothetical protein B0H14DRAFT_3591423 [Mycena olivaceomarginata]|nr:hypothetical protein B0H14DRAFT_3591423 [Mycena olivaceomarginata]
MTTKLEKEVNWLGLPKATAEAASKSPSQLSVSHMASVGWHIDLDNNQLPNELWDRVVPKMPKLTKQFAKSDPSAIADHIKKVRKMYMNTSSSDLEPVNISSHYQLKNNILDLSNEIDDARADTRVLEVCLHYVVVTGENAASKLIKWIDRTKRNDPANAVASYPHVDFIFDESPMKAVDVAAKKIKEAALISLLRLTATDVQDSATQNVSELTVERVVGSALSGVFYSANEVHIWSEAGCSQHSIRPSKAFAFPDIGAVRARGQANHIQPVVIIGEGKVKRRGLSDDDKPNVNKPSPRAQMAAAVHPTLILLVISHYEENNLSLEDLHSSTTFPLFDEKSMVYGIYYDEKEIRVYTHFPQVDRVDGRYVIRFYQFLVATFPLVDTSFWDRWMMAVSLFCIQKHADRLRHLKLFRSRLERVADSSAMTRIDSVISCVTFSSSSPTVSQIYFHHVRRIEVGHRAGWLGKEYPVHGVLPTFQPPGFFKLPRPEGSWLEISDREKAPERVDAKPQLRHAVHQDAAQECLGNESFSPQQARGNLHRREDMGRVFFETHFPSPFEIRFEVVLGINSLGEEDNVQGLLELHSVYMCRARIVEGPLAVIFISILP